MVTGPAGCGSHQGIIQRVATSSGVRDNSAPSTPNLARLDDTAAMALRVKRELDRSTDLKGKVAVGVGRRTVTLSGQVDTASQSKAAKDMAQRGARGYKVINQLRVKQ